LRLLRLTSVNLDCHTCISTLAVVGLMALKKAAVATPFMLPLIIATILFRDYINNQHYRVTYFCKYIHNCVDEHMRVWCDACDVLGSY
jgi:hypothetical protein